MLVYRYEKDGYQVAGVTTDHTCHVPEERALVAYLSSDPNPCRPSEIGLKTYGLAAPDRVAGSLAITRALGDGYLKRHDVSLPAYRKHLPYISSVPTVYHRHIHDSDIAIVLASDGLWNHLTAQECCQILRSSYEQSASAKQKQNEGDQLDARNTHLRLKNLDQVLNTHSYLQDERVHRQCIISWDSHAPQQPFDQSLDMLRNSLKLFPELTRPVSPSSPTIRAHGRLGTHHRPYPPPFAPHNEPTFQFTVKNLFTVTPTLDSLAYLRPLYEGKAASHAIGSSHGGSLSAKLSPPTSPVSKSSSSMERVASLKEATDSQSSSSTPRGLSNPLRHTTGSLPSDVKSPRGIAEMPRRTAAVAALKAISSSTSSLAKGIGQILDSSRPHHRIFVNHESICEDKYRLVSEKLLKQCLLNAAKHAGIDITSPACDFSFQSHRWKQRRDVIDDITVMVVPLQADQDFF
jgi:hypothetical protein